MKNKMSKRILSTVVIALMVIALVPVAFADGGGGVNVVGLQEIVDAFAEALRKFFSLEGFFEALRGLFS
ncbi:MAG: hypothetical protein IJF40_00610 [Clostridia bacterium]|nr:hypothetical protein [Clostridia bacterium]